MRRLFTYLAVGCQLSPMVSLGAEQKLAKPAATASKFGAAKKINSEFKTKWALKYSPQMELAQHSKRRTSS